MQDTYLNFHAASFIIFARTSVFIKLFFDTSFMLMVMFSIVQKWLVRAVGVITGVMFEPDTESLLTIPCYNQPTPPSKPSSSPKSSSLSLSFSSSSLLIVSFPGRCHFHYVLLQIHTYISCNRSERNVMSLEERRIATYFETPSTCPLQSVPSPSYHTHSSSLLDSDRSLNTLKWGQVDKHKGEETRILTVS